MASRVKRESEKRKKLAQRVAKYFKRHYGIEPDLVDYHALVDTNLTYKENIENLKRLLKKSEKVRSARDQLIQTIYEFAEYWEEYGGRSYAIDKGKRAKKVFDLEKASLKDLDRWLRTPNKYDIRGIDYPEKPKKRKRTKKATKKTGKKTIKKEQVSNSKTPKEIPVKLSGYSLPSFPYEEAYLGWYNLSQFPERQAKHDLEGYKRVILQYAQKVESAPLTNAEKKKLVEAFAKKWISKYRELARVRSTAASAHVVGPARFPAKSMEKKFNRIMKLEKELYGLLKEELKRLRKYLERKEVKEKGRSGVLREQVSQLKKELETLKKYHKIMKEANKIIRSKKLSESEKKKKLKALGVEKVVKAGYHFFWKPDEQGRVGFPNFDLTSNRNKIKRLEAKIKELEAKAEKAKMARDDKEVAYNSRKVKVVVNYGWDRVQIIFPGKPPKKYLEIVKRERFRYSPKTKSWVKKLTDYNIKTALEVAKKIEKA